MFYPWGKGAFTQSSVELRGNHSWVLEGSAPCLSAFNPTGSSALRGMIKTGTPGTCSSRGNSLCAPRSSELRGGVSVSLGSHGPQQLFGGFQFTGCFPKLDPIWTETKLKETKQNQDSRQSGKAGQWPVPLPEVGAQAVLRVKLTPAFVARAEQQQGFQIRPCSRKSVRGIYLGAACWEILPISFTRTPEILRDPVCGTNCAAVPSAEMSLRTGEGTRHGRGVNASGCVSVVKWFLDR